jgi:L-alanine-DL-glutamate epimerase-like enolase superfamily enzyme
VASTSLIDGYRLTRFRLPATRVLGDAHTRIDVTSVGSLELFAATGEVGTGFFASIFSPLPPLAELERAFALEVGPAVVGENAFALLNRLRRPRGGLWRHGFFAEAVDHALWDIAAKALGMPLYELLGARRDEVPVYASGLDYHLKTEESCSFFAGATDEGFRAVKAKVGYPTLDEELERLHAIVRHVGAGTTLMVDANEAWSPKEAIRRVHAYRDSGLDVYWLEDPCLRTDLYGLAAVARATPFTRVNAGEYLDVQGHLSLLAHQGVDVLNVHGDISGALESARLAALHGIPVSVGNSLGDVCVHVAAALPELTWMEWSFLGYEHLVEEPIGVRNGVALAPDRPGHGLSISERARREYASPADGESR